MRRTLNVCQTNPETNWKLLCHVVLLVLDVDEVTKHLSYQRKRSDFDPKVFF